MSWWKGEGSGLPAVYDDFGFTLGEFKRSVTTDAVCAASHEKRLAGDRREHRCQMTHMRDATHVTR